MYGMEILRTILIFLHLLGMAIIVGGYLANVKAPRVIPGMLHASYLQLITGIALFGLLEAQAHGLTMEARLPLLIKLVLGILVTVFAFIGNRQQKAADRAAATTEAGAGQAGTALRTVSASATMAHLTFGAAILAVVIAVFWVQA